MIKVTDYIVVSAPIMENASLADVVKELLHNGWHLYGYPFIYHGEPAQAMIRVVDESRVTRLDRKRPKWSINHETD